MRIYSYNFMSRSYSPERPVLPLQHSQAPNYRIDHGTLFLQHPTDDVSVLLHMAGRGLLGVGAGVLSGDRHGKCLAIGTDGGWRTGGAESWLVIRILV